MKTKLFIDQLYRDCNGAMTRAEILQRVNSAQNELFSDNVTEMREMTTVTVAKTPQVPVFLSATLNSSGEYGTQATYAVNDAFQYTGTYGTVTHVEYFRVVVPFTYGASAYYTNLADCCLPISYLDWEKETIVTKTYADALSVAAGDTVWDPDSGKLFRALQAFSATGDIAADIESYHLVLTRDEDATLTGTVAATGAAYPAYVELDLREVTKVGFLNTDGTFRETYTPRIVQSKGAGQPVRIYVDSDLPLDTALDIEGWRWPVQVLAESTAMEVPEVHQNGVLRTIVLKAVEEGAYGSSSYWAQTEQKMRKEWFDYVNRDKTRPPVSRRISYNPLAG